MEFPTTSIQFTSRASVKIGDSFYTFEATIAKSVPENATYEDIVENKAELWNECNEEVDKQIEETVEFLKKKR